MFVFSVKTSKTKIAALVIAIIALSAALFMVIGKGEKPVAKDSVINYKAETAAERRSFLSQFGWKISEDPVEVSEVIIPENFDDGYTEYAAMNKAQGLDLEPFKGMRAKRWTYAVLNYPGLENTQTVQANLLIFDGRVIGGDICSLEQGGFIRGFDFPVNEPPATTSAPKSAVTAEASDEETTKGS